MTVKDALREEIDRFARAREARFAGCLPAQIGDNVALADLNMDSLDMMELVADAEEEFGVTFATNFQPATLGDLLASIPAA